MTGIPSAPQLGTTPQQVEGLPALAPRFELLAEIAALLETGEAWSANGADALTAAPPHATLTAAPPHATLTAAPSHATLTAAPSPSAVPGPVPAASPLSGLAVELVDGFAAPTAQGVEVSPELQAVSIATKASAVMMVDPAPRSALAAAPADLPVQQGTDEPASGHVVQLGFRNGSLAVLDPASEQARALQALAKSLTRQD